MRNWRWIRKGGGGEHSFDARSLTTSNLDAVEADAGAVIAMTTASGFPREGVEASVTSRSRVVFAVVSRQLSAQHGIDACIVAACLPGFPMQQALAAGRAVAKSTSATTTAGAKRFANVEPGFTICPTPKAVSVFRDHEAVRLRTVNM